MTHQFKTYFELTKVSGEFADPFYPWLKYTYGIVTDGYAPVPENNYRVILSITSDRKDNSDISGEVLISVWSGGNEEGTNNLVKYSLETGDVVVLAECSHCRYRKDTIVFSLEHVKPPKFDVYRIDF